MEENKKAYKRLGIDMRLDMHAQIKAAAALRNISMSLLVHRALYNYLKKDPISLDSSRQNQIQDL